MSFLAKLSQAKKSANRKPAVQSHENVEDKLKSYSILPSNYVREEDPAVLRLKTLRRKENIKNGNLTRKTTEKKVTRRKTSADDSSSSTETVFKRKVSSSNTNSNGFVPKAKPSEPIKKVSFAELMKQAEQNATKPATSEIVDHRSSASKPASFGFKSSRPSKVRKPIAGTARPSSTNGVRHEGFPTKVKQKPVMVSKVRTAYAQPNKVIQQKLLLKKRRLEERAHRHHEDEYDDMDDFIDDDEDGNAQSQHERDNGYDRDEIWAMFNKGKKRSDYTDDFYDDDDIEANEFEIMEEEEQARKMAKLEDKREEQLLRKHEEEKMRRKNKK